jgi:xanthine/CO dehydrogenase XdhC/CoxF family maturation factor
MSFKMYPSLSQIAKQLPPSAAVVRVLDVGGLLGEGLVRFERPDVLAETASVLADHWQHPENSVDAIVAYDLHLTRAFLQKALIVLREGGRLVVANPHLTFDERWGRMFSEVGFVRLLIEPLESGKGLLLRGEKAHTHQDTLERIQVVTDNEADNLTLDTYRGRFVHLLIRQTPNIPVWKRTPNDVLTWEAVTRAGHYVAFTSLPKAVAFMQQAVLQGAIRDINKVGKFRLEVARTWQPSVLLNPSTDLLVARDFSFVVVDMHSAEAPDE